MLMAKAPGSWSGLLAWVLGFGYWPSFNGYGWHILLAQVTGLGCWPRLLVHVVDPCYLRRPKVFGPIF